jgi:hypothetical protein
MIRPIMIIIIIDVTLLPSTICVCNKNNTFVNSMNSGNPYTSYPLWHYFTLQFQNISLVGDRIGEFRSIDKDSDVNDNPIVSSLADLITVYDFMNDSVIRLSVARKRYPVMMYVGAGAFVGKVKDGIIPADQVCILKNGANVSGDVVPFIGKARELSLVIQLLTSVSKGTPFDMRSRLDPEDLSRIDELLKANIYNSVGISRIITSYKTCAVPKSSDTSNLAGVIARKIVQFMDGKYKAEISAINIDKGTVAGSKGEKTIMEFRVQLETGSPMVIKFAFPSDISPTKRDTLIQMLKTNFKAEQVHTPSDDERKSTIFKPVRIDSNSISAIFGAPREFSDYIASINRLERPEAIETSATLSSIGRDDKYRDEGEEGEEEVEDIQDDVDDEDNDYSED